METIFTQAMADFLNRRIGSDLIIAFNQFKNHFELNDADAYKMYQIWYNSERL